MRTCCADLAVGRVHARLELVEGDLDGELDQGVGQASTVLFTSVLTSEVAGYGDGACG